ncbi:GntR family transcriptional regulator [Salinicola aestuarinus]|uniref:GntR family transcriptional regulator n=1 Tax=Salinicola aestuarinus TaxID=1949082 RepID=UPI000DA248A4|nr:GntR family transcriptional regulator [Salinicola aestuarinus]
MTASRNAPETTPEDRAATRPEGRTAAAPRLSRLSRAQWLREQLENAIVDGHFAPGDRLDPVALARDYACSRTPIREALQQLEASGMVRVYPKRGTFVTQLGVADLIERFDVMAELEGMCARLAARRITQEELAGLRQAHESCRDCLDGSDADRYYHANGTFHHLIYAASHNAFLTQEATRLHAILKPYRRLQLHVHHRLQESFAEHEAILEAIERHDANAARRAIQQHVQLQGNRFNDLMATMPQLREDPLA